MLLFSRLDPDILHVRMLLHGAQKKQPPPFFLIPEQKECRIQGLTVSISPEDLKKYVYNKLKEKSHAQFGGCQVTRGS